jgi:hypothetical protein
MRSAGFTETSQKRPSYQEAPPELSGQFHRRSAAIDSPSPNDQAPSIISANPSAQRHQYLTHHPDVFDVGEVLKKAVARGQKGCSQNRERRILGAIYADLTCENAPTFNQYLRFQLNALYQAREGNATPTTSPEPRRWESIISAFAT